MTLPRWRSGDPEEQRKLARFILNELDKLDAAGPSNASPEAVEFLRILAELNEQAKRVGIILPLPPAADDNPADFDRAALDVPRIRALFILHWGKRNRTMPPSAEQIAAERWELSAADAAKLTDKFQRKTTVSQRQKL